MKREHYFTVEGPEGTAEIYEILDEQYETVKERNSFEPVYEVAYRGKSETFSSEGEAITVAQQKVGARSSY